MRSFEFRGVLAACGFGDDLAQPLESLLGPVSLGQGGELAHGNARAVWRALGMFLPEFVHEGHRVLQAGRVPGVLSIMISEKSASLAMPSWSSFTAFS